MDLYPTRYVAKVPPQGFQWLYSDGGTGWRRLDPPDDWGRIDDEPTLMDKFFLAAPAGKWSPWPDQPWDDGNLLKPEPDLYLRFASAIGSPDSILNYANRYGLLGPDIQSAWTDKALWPEYDGEPGFSPTGPTYFHAEPAEKWLSMMGSLNYALRKWTEVGGPPGPKHGRFLKWYNEQAEGTLGFRGEYGPDNSQLNFGVVASSLSGLLLAQFAEAVAVNVQHVRCDQCQSFFPVHPGLGREGKKYCSNACRMRAYRKRKGGH